MVSIISILPHDALLGVLGFALYTSLSHTLFNHLYCTVVEELFSKAHEYANLANRAGPIASDLVLACDDYNLPPAELYSVQRKALGRKKSSTSLSPTKTEGAVPLPSLVPPPSRSPSPELLPSDDESGAPTRPTTLRGIGSYFPTLPPKHTYLRTPVSTTDFHLPRYPYFTIFCS